LFISSRRRHTIFSRDWSSDVCSSDLMPSKVQCLAMGSNSEMEQANAFSLHHGRPISFLLKQQSVDGQHQSQAKRLMSWGLREALNIGTPKISLDLTLP